MLGLPLNTIVGRAVPKNSFDKQLGRADRDLLTTCVDSIRWEHRLAQDTTGLESCDLEEIQVLSIKLKSVEKVNSLLNAIDVVMPYYILFVLINGDMVKYHFAVKHRSVKDEDVCVIDDFFESDWMREEEGIDKIDVVGSLSSVALDICKIVAGDDSNIDDIGEYVALHKKKVQLRKQIEQITRQIDKCKQFNKKVELNRTLQALIRESQSV